MTSPVATAVRRAARWQVWRGVVRRANLPWLPLIILGSAMVLAIFTPAPHDPTRLNLLDAKQAPFADWSHPLGTDVLGRDILSRLIHGARTTMLISMTALGAGAAVGTLLGLISGYRGGWLDMVIMRIADGALGFPSILVAMIIMVILGAGLVNIVLAVLLTVWARFARMIRGEVLSIKELDFVKFAQITGVPARTILRRHVFPNTVNTLMVITSLQVGQVILLEASLSFLGLGLAPGSASWGIMVAEGQNVIVDVWWLALFPGLAITVMVLAFNSLGDWLRDNLDPRLRRARL